MTRSDLLQTPDLFHILVKPGVQPLALDVQLAGQILDLESGFAGPFLLLENHLAQTTPTAKFATGGTTTLGTTPATGRTTPAADPTPTRGDPAGPPRHQGGTGTHHFGHRTLHLAEFLLEAFLSAQKFDDPAELFGSQFC